MDASRRCARSVAAVGVGTLVAALAACAPTNSTISQTPAGGTGSPVGYSALFLQDPAQTSMVTTFQKQTTQDGLTLLPPVSANGDAVQQDTDIRNLVTAGAKSLFVVPADPQAVVPALQFAQSKGVPVIGLMLGPDGGGADLSLEVDNKEVGKQACEFLAAKVGDHGTVLAIQGDMRAVTARDRDTSFRDCMQSAHPGITVVVKPGGQWDPPTAAASAAAVVNSNPELGGVFMASDGYVDSVAQVLTSAGKTAAAGAPGHVYTIAVDGTPAALKAIRDGRLDATAAQPVTDFVTHGLAYLKQLTAGNKIAPGKTDHGSTVVMTSSSYPADVFPPKLITRDNVDDSSNWANGS